MIVRLKYIILLVILGMFGCLISAIGQQLASGKSFVYIQNENGSPFYVREQNNTVLSSSHAGYIIIPQLSKGNYVFIIGLPGDQAAEAAFEIQLNGDSDKGLLLREGNGQLALYSLKDFHEIQPVAVASAPGNRIVNLPSAPSPVITNQPSVEQQPAVSIAINQNETPAASQKDTSQTNAFSQMLNKIMGTSKKPAITSPSSQSQQPIFLDSTLTTPVKSDKSGIASSSVVKSNTDTMQNAVVNNPGINSAETSQNLNNNNMGTNNTPPSTPISTTNNGLQFINFLPDSSKVNPMPKAQTLLNNSAPMALPANRSSSEVSSLPVNNDTTSQIVIGNSDCQQMASENFFQKVRRKMASRSDDEGIFHIAHKYFSGGICFSTQQIQSLIYLFSTDEYKYKFLELAYPHAYDSNHFPSLIKALGSNYYRQRFKAMVR